MHNVDWDKLLEEGLSGDPPGRAFREQVLRDSVLAFQHGRQSRARWRMASRAAAAVLVAGVSFLVGRWSLPSGEAQPVPVVTPVVGAAQNVPVPPELVAWLDAARLFGQLGMEDRMARAVDRASKLLPHGTAMAAGATGTMVAAGADIESMRKDEGPGEPADRYEPLGIVNRVMALSLRGQDHEE